MIHEQSTCRSGRCGTRDVPGQRSFHQLRLDAEAPRVPTRSVRDAGHRDALAIAEDCSRSPSPARQAALDQVERELREWIGRLGPGREFFTQNFVDDLRRRGLVPESIDMRCVGGIVNRLAGEGLIESLGVANNGGSQETSSNSSPRQRWRVCDPTGGTGVPPVRPSSPRPAA